MHLLCITLSSRALRMRQDSYSELSPCQGKKWGGGKKVSNGCAQVMHACELIRVLAHGYDMRVAR